MHKKETEKTDLGKSTRGAYSGEQPGMNIIGSLEEPMRKRAVVQGRPFALT